MSTRVEGEPLVPGIGARIHRRLTKESAEVVVGVAAGSLSFISVYEYMAVTGQLSIGTFLYAVAAAMAGSTAGEIVAIGAKQALTARGVRETQDKW